jgi:kynurenine formamidase
MRGVNIVTKHTIKDRGWNTSILQLFSHAGTHIDSQKHFIDEGEGIDQIDLRKCIGTAMVIDVGFIKPKESITVKHIEPYADKIKAGARILLKTGWSSHIDLPDYRTHMPSLSLYLVKFFIEKKIVMLGVEPPSVADLSNLEETITVHKALLKAGIVIIEGLSNLVSLKSDTIKIIALPLKIRGIDGSPARVIAIEKTIYKWL